MGSKKLYITLIIIVFVFCIVMFALFGINELADRRRNTVLIVGENAYIYENQSWKLANSYSDLDWEKYDIYIDNKKIGNYYLTYSDGWYAFDDKKNAIDISGNLIAYSGNDSISVYDFTEEEIDDYTYVNEVLDELGIDEDTSSSYKISFDYDNDGEKEDFYVVSNVFTSNPTNKFYSIVFMVKNNKIYNIYKNTDIESVYDGCKPYFDGFIDVNNDKKYEFVLSCAEYSVSETTSMLYQYEDNEFKILISN